MKALLGFAAFQASWWAAILAARSGADLLGIAAVLAFNVPFIWASESRRGFAAFVAAATVFGIVVDSAMVASGTFRISAGWQPAPWLCAPWLAAMWLNLAVSIDTCMGWMKGRPLLASAFGAVGGPLSYWAGERLGVVAFDIPTPAALGVLAAAWALAMPALLWMHERAGRLATQSVTQETR